MLVKDEHSNTRTCLSLDNSGNIRFDTDIEMTQGVFNTSKSVLWTKFSRVFATEIRDRYVELRKDKFTIDNFMKYYYEGQISKIPEMDYNKNFYNKYLATKDRQAYLFMMHGRQYEYMYKWIDERLYFLDTYWSYGSEFSSQCTVRVEYADYATIPVTFNIQTYIPSYVEVIFKNSGSDGGNNDMIVRKKVGRGQTIEFSKYITTSTDQEIIIYNASNLKSIGDISIYTPKTVLVGDAIKIVELSVGTDEHSNPNLQDLSLSNNVYLTKLTANNCTALKSSLNLSGCSNLEYFSAQGSSVATVQFPDGAPLKTIILPKSTTALSLKNLTVLDDLTIESDGNGNSKLTSINIINCPKLTGYKDDDGNIVEGPFANTFLNNYKPTNSLTRILNLEVYGYVNSATFLNAAATLANNYPDNFNISGKIRYNGSSIPTMYSYYEKDFPNLKVTYDNVNDVSNMFAKYNNIKAVWHRTEKHGTDDDVRTEVAYYWTDLREGEFPEEAYYTYEGVKGRLLDYYDDVDMLGLADEIRTLLKPFSKFTNMNSMFQDMRCFEYLHDDTFDGINVETATSRYMFSGCSTLKYFECPKTMTYIYEYAFANCYNVVAYIPSSVHTIAETAFYTNSHTLGSHPVLLFESDLQYWLNQKSKGIRDARINIVRDPNTGRAIRESKETIEGVPVTIKYFLNGNTNKRIIKEIYNEDKIDIDVTSFNYTSENPTSNPLNISELLAGSLKYFTHLNYAAIPSYGISEVTNDSYSTNYAERLTELECSIARIFNDGFIVSADADAINITNLYIIPSDNDRKCVNEHFLASTSCQNIYLDREIKTIANYAFQYTKCKTIDFLFGISATALTHIGDRAFSESTLERIYIPDTVTSLGEAVYYACNNFTDLHYSSSLTEVPADCFRDAMNSASSKLCESISGFSANITKIGSHAFDNAVNLRLFVTNSNTGQSYFVCDSSKSKNIDYFTSLKEIGAYAFRNINNITRLNISDQITEIGDSAFYLNSSSSVTDTLMQWTGTDYSKCSLGNLVFFNRQLSWYDTESDTILEKCCYIPDYSYVGNNAFTPFIKDNIYSTTKTAQLDYILVSEDKETIAKKWATFVVNHLETIYNFVGLTNYTDKNNFNSNLLYFATEYEGNKEAMVAKLLQYNNSDSTTVYIPDKIEYKNNDYVVKEILSEALTHNDSNLNNLYFSEKSTLRRLGNKIFDTTGIINVNVVANGGDHITNSDGTYKFIPDTVVYSEDNTLPIGENIPWKDTSWFKYSTGVENNFVYLNEYCLGFAPNTTDYDIINIKEGTKFIYDSAFASEMVSTISLPSTLIRIMQEAFAYSNISSIDFTPCTDSLTYIGDSAFAWCSSIAEVDYTKNISHIGTKALSNNSRLQKVTFAEDMVLDNTSEPITPIVNNKEINTTITDFVISASMGNFFSPAGVGYTAFKKMSNLSTLVLSTVQQTISLPEITADGEYSDLYESDWETTGEKHYVIDFSKQGLDTLYPEATYLGTPLRIVTTDDTFACPNGDYTADIDISNITTELDSADIVRLLLGTAKNVTQKIYVKSKVAAQMSASIYNSIKAVRPINIQIMS